MADLLKVLILRMLSRSDIFSISLAQFTRKIVFISRLSILANFVFDDVKERKVLKNQYYKTTRNIGKRLKI